MVLDLIGKKVVVTGGEQFVEHAIAEGLAPEGTEVLIWLRKCNDEVNEAKVLPITQLKVPSHLSNGTRPTSLWRQTIVEKSYW
jgi:NAD(P)-dependent dehydrogenase (short-subunit alcohol dehydrogenase family)